MPGIVLVTMIVVITVIVMLFLHDTRQHRQTPSTSTPRRQPARQRPPEPPTPQPEEVDVDVEGLAEHVRELRRAIDEGLIGREEAVGSIVRQAVGKVGEGVAERLLDSAELD